MYSYYPLIITCSSVFIVFAVHGLKIIPEGPKSSRWVNESFVLTCIEEGDMTGRKLEWSRAGAIDSSAIMQPGNNGHQLALLVYFSKKHNGGEYTCNLKDTRTSLIMDSKSITMYIFDLINFIGPQNRTARENDQAELVCKFSYDEMFSVSVSWLRNGIEPLDGSSSKYRISNAEGRPYTSTLTISSVKKEDAGTYTCQVLVNSIMKTDIKLFTLGLDVVYAPKFLSNLSYTGYIDEKKFMVQAKDKMVSLKCAVDANPKAQLTWQLYPNRALNNETINYTYQIKSGDNWSELKLTYKSSSQNAKYRTKEKTVSPNEFRCDASNSYGEDSRRYYVKISKLPKMPEILQYTMLDNMLTLSVKEQKTTPSIDKYRVRIADKNFEFTANSDSNQTYTIPIENVPGGDHAFRLFAHNPVGWSEPLALETMKLSINFSTSSFTPKVHILMLLSATSAIIRSLIFA